VQQHPRTLFIVDEAFIEFTNAIPSVIRAITSLPNLVILRSLTKAFAIPGLRLGYIAAPAAIIEKIKALKMPWSVNAMALAAGHYIFDHYETLGLPLTNLLADRVAFVQQLQEVSIKVIPSHTHFFCCETPSGTAGDLQRYLLDHHGILIRDAANFRGLSPRHFRLATGTPDRNQLLINALKEWRPQ
jgi:threonine-phosphate decarboxylase